MQLLERWEEHTYRRAVDQHNGKKEAPTAPPVEKDLTEYKPYQLLIKAYPNLERQLKLAWNGDAKAKAKGEDENEYIFPKLLKTENLEKYEDRFVINRETMQTVKELFDLFCSKFKIANKKHNGWFTY